MSLRERLTKLFRRTSRHDGDQALALKTLRTLHAKARKNLKDRGDDPSAACVLTAGWSAALERNGIARDRFREIADKLQRRGLIELHGVHVVARNGAWNAFHRKFRSPVPEPAAQLPEHDELAELRRALLALSFSVGAQPGVYTARLFVDLLEASTTLWPDSTARPRIVADMIGEIERGAKHCADEHTRRSLPL